MRAGLILLLAAAFLPALHATPPPGGVSVTASETDKSNPPAVPVKKIYFLASGTSIPPIHAISEAFASQNPDILVQQSYLSSNGVGKALMDGKIFFGVMSRALDSEEKNAFQEKYGYPLIEFPLFLDALRIVVHSDNPLASISISQLNGIYADKPAKGTFAAITNWSEFGLEGKWPQELIICYGGAPDWGTTKSFEALIMDGGKCIQDVKVKDIEDIPEAVSRDSKGIGYTCLGSEGQNCKFLPVSIQEDGNAVEPSRDKIISGEYPLSRRFYLYLNADPKKSLHPGIRAFIEFIYSAQGQKLIEENNFIFLDARESIRVKNSVRALP